MALTRTTRASATGGGPAGTANITTGSFTPSNSSLLVAICGGTKDNIGGGDRSGALTITDSAGLTWTSRKTVGQTDSFGSMMRLWTAPVTTGSSMTVTFGGGDDKITFFGSVIEYTGHNTGSPTGATASDTSSDSGDGGTFPVDGAATLTLSAGTASDSEVFGGVQANIAGSGVTNATPGAGHTEIHDLTVTDFGGLETLVRDTGSTSTAFSWADVQAGDPLNRVVALAVEIKAAGAAQDPDVPILRPYAVPQLNVYRM